MSTHYKDNVAFLDFGPGRIIDGSDDVPSKDVFSADFVAETQILSRPLEWPLLLKGMRTHRLRQYMAEENNERQSVRLETLRLRSCVCVRR